MKFSMTGVEMRPRTRARVRACALAAFLVSFTPQVAKATIQTNNSDVTPVPPAAGGNINTTFIIGDTSYGFLNVIASNPSTPLVVTGANNAIIADELNVTAAAGFSGVGSNLSVGQDLLVGNKGFGSLTVTQLARVSATRNLVLAVADDSTGRVFLNDAGTIVEALDDLIVGQAGTALVQALQGSRVFSENAIIGSAATADGTVTINGSDTLWQQSGAITIGSAGRAYVQVVNQGRMETKNATIGSLASGNGNTNVSGVGSVWNIAGTFTLGLAGQASINLSEGGRITNTGAARIGVNAGSEGTALVSGATTVWGTGASLTVGEQGTGILRVIGGGRVNSLNSIIGLSAAAGARGEVALDGTGTVWDVTGTLDVGNVVGAEAVLSITGGAAVSTTGVTRVRSAGEIFMNGGRLNVGAVGGLSNEGLVQGGGRINGAFNNLQGGDLRLRANNSLVLGGALQNGVAASVHLDGGELEVIGLAFNAGDIAVRDAVVRFSGRLDNVANGQLAILGGDSDIFGNVTNAAGGEIVVDGGARAVFHGNVTNSGDIFVRPGSEMLMLKNLTFDPTSQLNLSLSSLSEAQDFASLDVSGNTTLAGELSVQLRSGYMPELGDAFKVVEASGGLTGTFSTQSLPSLSSGLAWDLEYDANSVTLSVVAGSGGSADFDGDGDVDGADLTRWRNNFGAAGSATNAQGDSDGDADVDGSDFLTWQRQVGSTPPTAAAAAAIPEPAAASMLFTIAIAALAARRRH